MRELVDQIRYAAKASVSGLDSELLEIIRCPVSLQRLNLRDGWLYTDCGGFRYPVVDGIPVLLANRREEV